MIDRQRHAINAWMLLRYSTDSKKTCLHAASGGPNQCYSLSSRCPFQTREAYLLSAGQTLKLLTELLMSWAGYQKLSLRQTSPLEPVEAMTIQRRCNRHKHHDTQDLWTLLLNCCGRLDFLEVLLHVMSILIDSQAMPLEAFRTLGMDWA